MIKSAKAARKLMKKNPEMFDGLIHTHDFKKWLRTNWHVYKDFERRALQIKRKTNHDKYGAQTIIEVMRWHSHVSSDTEDYKMPNIMTAYLSRLAMLGSSELDGMFRVQRHRGRML